MSEYVCICPTFPYLLACRRSAGECECAQGTIHVHCALTSILIWRFNEATFPPMFNCSVARGGGFANRWLLVLGWIVVLGRTQRFLLRLAVIWIGRLLLLH